MQTWLNFWNVFFWLTLCGFFTNAGNFLKLLFFSEITWLTLYCYILLIGSINDDLTLLSSSFFILGLAGIEYAIGLILIILFRNIHKSLDFSIVETQWSNKNLFNAKKLKI